MAGENDAFGSPPRDRRDEIDHRNIAGRCLRHEGLLTGLEASFLQFRDDVVTTLLERRRTRRPRSKRHLFLEVGPGTRRVEGRRRGRCELDFAGRCEREAGRCEGDARGCEADAGGCEGDACWCDHVACWCGADACWCDRVARWCEPDFVGRCESEAGRCEGDARWCEADTAG